MILQVFFSSSQQIGRLIDNLSSGMDAGLFQYRSHSPCRQPVLLSLRVGRTLDGGRTARTYARQYEHDMIAFRRRRSGLFSVVCSHFLHMDIDSLISPLALALLMLLSSIYRSARLLSSFSSILVLFSIAKFHTHCIPYVLVIQYINNKVSYKQPIPSLLSQLLHSRPTTKRPKLLLAILLHPEGLPAPTIISA